MVHSDYKLLGISETADLETIRRAYRKRAKETHPDSVSDLDPFKRHLLFIEVTKTYQRLVQKSVEVPCGKGRSGAPAKVQSQGAMAKHRDPAYAYYKQGMKAFMQIHPSGWKPKSGQLNREGKTFLRVGASEWGLDSQRIHSTNPINTEDRDRIREKIRGLAKLSPKAYYYFGLVVAEHPQSEWAYDAKQKLRIIEERTQRYTRILKSFGL